MHAYVLRLRPKRARHLLEKRQSPRNARNIHVHGGVSEDEFVTMRQVRGATLGMLRLIIPSIQVNMRVGRLPPAADNGCHYLKIPINAL